MTTAEISTKSVLDAVRSIVPALRANGLEAEEKRWIPQENIDLLEEAGVFRMAVPKRFGGLDLPLADQFDVLAEIGRGCGSTSWVSVAWVSSAWMASLYPDETQEEVFANGTVRISGGFTPTGVLTPTEGGYLLNGTWRFNTGCRGAHWDLLAAMLEKPGEEPEEVFALVPMSEMTIADDWDVTAAAGTGSSSTTAKNLFVPARRVATSEDAVLGTTGGRSNTGATGRNYGLIAFVMAESVATYVGMARAALELFLARTPGKAVAYSNVTDQAQHPVTQIAAATAANKITAAEALSDRFLAVLQRRADIGEQPTWDERAEVRGQCGYAIQLLKEAVETIQSVSSASIILRTSPLQRFVRDMQGLALHGLMNPNINLEVHGRVLLGLDPDTPFL